MATIRAFALPLLAALGLLAGCAVPSGGNTNNPSGQTGQNLYELIKSTPELSAYAAKLTPAQIAYLSDPANKLTVFAPNNAGMNPEAAMYQGISAPFPTGKALENTLNGQMLPVAMDSAALTAAIDPADEYGSLDALLGDQMYVSQDDKGGLAISLGFYHISFLDSYPDPELASVVRADLKASNGVLHITNSLVFAATVGEATFDSIANAGDEAAYGGPLRDLNAFDDLKANGPFTVFIPWDTGFEALDQDERDCLLNNRAVLKRVLDHNILENAQLLTADIAKLSTLTTRAGDTIAVGKNAGGEITLDGIALTADDPDGYRWTDWVWRNGVTHYTDEPLIPASVDLAACTVN